MNDQASVEYRDIEWILMQRHAQSLIMPRFTPQNWWECDVIEITKNDYMREFEIKMSRADFKVDSQKNRIVFSGDYSQPYNERPKEYKHALLASGDPRGPSMFYFVSPVGVLEESDIPAWAGFIEVTRRVGATWGSDRVVKPAPRLHKNKVDDKIKRAMTGVCYGRLHAIWSDNYSRFRDARYIKERPAFVEDAT